jgi:tetratricopeptide (TPR) repeat protein
MAAQVPTIRQISWIAIVPQVIIIGLLNYLFQKAQFPEPFIFAALTWTFLAITLRKLIAKEHRQGIKLVKQQKFTDAIPFFERSYEYFTKYKWIDKFRFLTLLSISKMSYTESALCNLAFCYSQTGNGLKAKEYYEQALREYPENGLAKAGLNMLNSIMQNKESENTGETTHSL